MKPRRKARGGESYRKQQREIGKLARAREKEARKMERELARAPSSPAAPRAKNIPNPVTIFKHVQLANLYRKGVSTPLLETIIWRATMAMKELNPKTIKPLSPDAQEKMCQSIFGTKQIPTFVFEMRERNIRQKHFARHILLYSLLVHGVTYTELRAQGFDKKEIITAYEETPQYMNYIHEKRK